MIIDSPSDIPRACPAKIRPPSVCFRRIWIKVSERVDKSCIDECLKACSFFIRKSSTPTIRFGILKIDISMCHIEIATKNNGLFGFQSLHMLDKCSIPTLSVFQSLELRFRVGSVNRGKIKIREFEREHSPLIIRLYCTV